MDMCFIEDDLFLCERVIMKRAAIILLLVVSLGLAGCVENLKADKTIVPAKAGYVLTFSDEFDGDKLDESKWRMGYPGWTAPEFAPMAYVHDANQCKIKDGINYMTDE